jgi:hypothetical protein
MISRSWLFSPTASSACFTPPIPTRAVHGHRELLRLYAALNPTQRARLETTSLRLGELSAPQEEFLRAWKPAAVGNTETRLGLRRELEAVVFTLATAVPAPQEERVPLEPGRLPASNWKVDSFPSARRTDPKQRG